MNRSLLRAPLAFFVALAAGACSAGSGTDIDPSGVVFLAQGTPPGMSMDALFQGTVSRDAQGCLRLGLEPDRHTVVWPYGFTIESVGGTLFVKDASGRGVGRIGGAFKLGGGEVASLHDGLALSNDARTAAETRCPGRYWIVGGVL